MTEGYLNDLIINQQKFIKDQTDSFAELMKPQYTRLSELLNMRPHKQFIPKCYLCGGAPCTCETRGWK